MRCRSNAAFGCPPRQPDEQTSVMRPGGILPYVGKVEILRDEESTGRLRGVPDIVVILPGEVFVRHRVHVVAEAPTGFSSSKALDGPLSRH